MIVMRTVVFIFTLLLSLHCRAQNSNSNLKKTEMRTIDLNNFKDLPLDMKHKSLSDSAFYRTDKESIHVMTRQGRIQVEKKEISYPYSIVDIYSPYAAVEVYSEKTKSLIVEGKKFRDFPIGIWKEYDEKGKLIKEINQDSSYRFSIESLIEKMKREYEIDIFDERIAFLINRISDENTNQPYYEVVYRKHSKQSQTGKFLLLDGNTGAVVYKGVIGFSDYESPYERYKKSLHKKYDYYINDSSNLKKIDLNAIKDLPLNEKYYGEHYSDRDFHYKTDKETIRLIISKDNIQLIKKERGSPYTVIESYSLKTNSLIGEGKKFGRMPVGIWKTYDEQGNLIKETDLDSGFEFSSEDLIKKIKTEFDIDVNDETQISVVKYGMVYGITHHTSGWDEGFLVDGCTGALLFRGYIDPREPLYAKFLKITNIEAYEKFMEMRSKTMRYK